MDFLYGLFIFIWVVTLFNAVFRVIGRGQKNRKPYEDPGEEILVEEKPRPVEKPSYDYERLRKKIRKSWEIESDETPVEAVPKSQPVPIVEKHPVVVTPRLSFKPEKKMPVEPDTVLSVLPLKPKKRMPLKKGTEWTEDDVRRWVVYDAVFGSPRSKSRWKPFVGA